MRKLYLLAIISIASIICILASNSVGAVDGGVVISQVQIGDISSSRLIEIYNNSDESVDITGWCVYHSSASGKTKDMIVCFKDSNVNLHLILSSKSYVLIGSAQFGIAGDFTMTKGLGGVSGGHIYILDNNGVERDSLGWGNADPNNEGLAAVIGPDNQDSILERKQASPGVYVDTNVNINDFKDSIFRDEYKIGAISEVIDVCQNISGIQVVIPDKYYRDILENCVQIPTDVCLNISGLQTTIPIGYVIDDNNNCQIDVCQNIDGLQLILPSDMYVDVAGDCKLNILPLKITELLPNALGNDTGNEFIEIYNPNSEVIDLANYYLAIGDSEKSFDFPTGSHIDPGQYLAFSNDDIKFTLLNTTGYIQLIAKDGTLFDKTPIYSDPPEGNSWALIEGNWQYTNQLTPNLINLPSKVAAAVAAQSVVESEIKPCADNQYRSPDTNRCRLLPTSDLILTPCKDGQYRSEETNRCRSIASDVVALIPCGEGEERNPDTNRCRSIAAVLSDSDLKPCEVNQERNPETNRCRNIVSSMPQADYAPEQTNQSSNNHILWWSLVGVGSVAIIYGIWEWRQEISQLARKLVLFRRSNK